MTQGLLGAMVAHFAPADLRGTAYGFFNLACGIAALFASVLAGLLWSTFGTSYTFFAGSAFGIIALIGMTGIPRLAERSEEHTSELQSLMRISYAVFCLKKKKQQ